MRQDGQKSKSAGQPIRILIADNNPIVREGLTSLINKQADMTLIAEETNGNDVIERFHALKPDITVIGLKLPQVDGIGVLQAICGIAPDARILVLSNYQGTEDIHQAIKAGARAYLFKTASREEVLEAIRKVHAGQTHMPPAVTARLMERLEYPELTSKEQEILRQIIAGKCNLEIAETLCITVGTVKVHVHSILSKLKVSDRTQAAVTAIKRGIVRMKD